MLEQITPLILARDEEANIGRTLGQLTWAREVVLVDSFSDDRTVEIARSFPNVRVVQRSFDIHAVQWQFGASLVTTDWLLTLDADYYIPDELTGELAALAPPPDAAAYDATFIYAVNGRPLRGSLYPTRPVLLRRGRFEFWQDGHTQRVRVHGPSVALHTPIIHDDRKSLRRFMQRQRGYMRQEAAKLRATPFSSLNALGKLRKLRVVAPFAAPAYTLVVKRTILDGLPGLQYAFERFVAEAILSVELFRA
jgi:glycosyltransferase involved in cell wall biosynthesis